MIHPVILCGGSGTRLWPLSRKAFPKQFIPLVGDKSLLTLTLARARAVAGPGAVLTCVSADDHRFLVSDAAAACGEASVQQILEPAARNTAAAIALAALAAPAPDAVLLICPADHHIPDTAAFVASVQGALGAADAGALVTFGIVPTFPSTAYGYIEQGAPAAEGGFGVQRFVEKPPQDRALAMLSQGRFFWNAGIFLARADAWLAALQGHAPDILASCRQAMSLARRDGDFLRPDAAVFVACRSDSIDYAVMEKADNVVVFPFLGAWSDVGSWNAVADMVEPSEAGNRSSGDGRRAHHLLSSNTYIHACGGRPVVALGTDNILVIDTPDALLVADRRHAESVKQVVARLESLDAAEALHHRRVARPWGWYDSVDVGSRHQVKRLTVKPGASLSLQMHHHRTEHWVVVSGVAEVVNGDQTMILQENESTFIPMGQRHRLANPGSEPLEIIEVQSGAYLGEDDIVRFEDAYGRMNERGSA
ncbi:MAG: mannose-1-phosphate guanylyltransferase/mannose-6-phosphate isomerase [Burkholderiales bacterium]|nr:mannose-1-phosphate guanylyltransferase/mannose-6-phosphate isomerase [Burkholderiales bacterium]